MCNVKFALLISKLTFLLSLLRSIDGVGQSISPYSLQTSKELSLTLISSATLSFGHYLDLKHPLIDSLRYNRLQFKLSSEALITPEAWCYKLYNARVEDRIRIRPKSVLNPDLNSTVLLTLSIAGGLFFPLGNSETRSNGWNISTMYLEASVLNWGLNDVFKSITRRPRPKLYYFREHDGTIKTYNEFLTQYKKPREANLSFWSGHTSVTATSTFFIARVISDYTENNSLKIVYWVGGATIPAIVAYLRMRGGNHFFSDVLMGYIIGGAIGAIVIPELHQMP